MRQAKKEEKAREAAMKLAIKEAKAEAERIAQEEEAALTAGLDDLEKVLMRSTIRAKVSRTTFFCGAEQNSCWKRVEFEPACLKVRLCRSDFVCAASAPVVADAAGGDYVDGGGCR